MNVHVSVLQEEEIKVGLESEIIQGGGTVSGDYIPVPSTAEVGQTIVVKAVDESGKPTEWEAVDAADAEEIDKRLSSLADENAELKDDLADKLPKSPVNWEQWTAQEQAAACNRVGAIRSYGDGWTLKAKWTSIDPITVDFSGCSEFFIAGYIKSTGEVSLYTNLIANQICFRFSYNGARYVRMLYCNQPTGGIAPIFAKYSTASVVQADNLIAYCIGSIGDTRKVSDITTFSFNNTNSIESLDIEIFAR